MKNLLPLLVIVGLFIGMISIASAAEKAKPKYVGLKACKMCHSNAKMGGEEYKIYITKDHAKAFETLKSDESKAIAAKLGIKDPTKDAKCLKCHTTAYGLTKLHGKDYKVEEGVTCEACHGAGEKYKPMPIMKDHDKSVANGLLIPDEKLCLTCHNDESPTYKKFDYKTKTAAIKHWKDKNETK